MLITSRKRIIEMTQASHCLNPVLVQLLRFFETKVYSFINLSQACKLNREVEEEEDLMSSKIVENVDQDLMQVRSRAKNNIGGKLPIPISCISNQFFVGGAKIFPGGASPPLVPLGCGLVWSCRLGMFVEFRKIGTKKIFILLAVILYSETYNERRDPSPRLSAWTTQLWKSISAVASCRRHCVRFNQP